VMRRKYQITRNRVQLHSRLESLLEEAHIKLSSLVSDLLGTSARRMLQALADGETDPATVASLADQRLRATAAQLADALSAGPRKISIHCGTQKTRPCTATQAARALPSALSIPASCRRCAIASRRSGAAPPWSRKCW